MSTMSRIHATLVALAEGDDGTVDELATAVQYLQSMLDEKQGEEPAL